MNYFSLFSTTEGDRLGGLSNLPAGYTIPPNAVSTDDLVLPADAIAAGATDWNTFNDLGFASFYLYDGNSTLQLRSLDYWYYTVPASQLVWVFTNGDQGFPLNPEQTTFVTTAYTGLEVLPLVVYAEEDGAVYDGITYSAAEQLVIYDQPTPPVPTGFTLTQPFGVVSAYDTWQWNGTAWVSSPFPITLDLAGAQDYLTKLVQANATLLINNQLSSYDTAQIAEAVDPELLEPRYKAVNLYPTIGDYRTAVAVETAPQFAAINAATTVNQLYAFDPTVDEPPNY